MLSPLSSARLNETTAAQSCKAGLKDPETVHGSGLEVRARP